MARPRKSTIRVATLNIAANPHPTGVYTDMLFEARRRLVRTSYRGSDYVVIGGVEKKDESPGLIFGRLFVFTELDTGGQWLNARKMEPASQEDLKDLYVPEDVKPNLREFHFVFQEKNS